MRKTFDEEPSLVELYGDDIATDIIAVGRETGTDPRVLLEVMRESPELMGYYFGVDPKTVKPRFGSRFADVFSTITEGIGKAAPGVSEALAQYRAAGKRPAAGGGFVGPPAPVQTAARGSIDPIMLLIPAAAAAMIFLIMGKRKGKK